MRVSRTDNLYAFQSVSAWIRNLSEWNSHHGSTTRKPRRFHVTIARARRGVQQVFHSVVTYNPGYKKRPRNVTLVLLWLTLFLKGTMTDGRTRWSNSSFRRGPQREQDKASPRKSLKVSCFYPFQSLQFNFRIIFIRAEILYLTFKSL